MFVSEDIKRAYPIYSLLDPEQKEAACEIAQKYPCTTEYVAGVIIEKGFNQEETEKYIRQEMILGRFL